MSVTTKLARKVVKTTAKHTARGTVSKFAQRPFRSVTLLVAGAAIGVMIGLLIGRRRDEGPVPIVQAPAPADAATNNSTVKSSETGVTT